MGISALDSPTKRKHMETTPEVLAAVRDFQKLVTNLTGKNAKFKELLLRALNEQDDTAAPAPDPGNDREPISMIDYGDEALTGDDIFSIIELLTVDRRVVLKGKAITLNDLRNLRALLTSQFYDVLIEPGFALDTMVYVAICSSSCTKAEHREFFNMVHDDIRAAGSLEYEVNMMCAGIRNDAGYRLSWIANLAQAFVSEGMEHFAAQQGAANFLDMLAHCDARADEHFQHPPKTEEVVWADTAPPETVGCARAAHLGGYAFNSEALTTPTRRTLTIELDKDDPAPGQTIAFILSQLTGKEIAKPRLRWRDGLLVYVLEDENAEVAIIQVPSE